VSKEADFNRAKISKPPNFSSTAQNTSKPRFNELASDFTCAATEIGMLSNGFSVS